MFRALDNRVAVVVVILLVVTAGLAGGTGNPAVTTADTRLLADSVTYTDTGTAASALAAARDLADARLSPGVIGPDLVAELGYTPVPERSLAAKLTGDCSSPVPLPRSFEPSCRVHDLGYDLLRVAHRHHAPIPPGLRADLDTLLARQMRDSCEGRLTCTLIADIAHTAVHLNTLRQGHGAPVEESLPW